LKTIYVDCTATLISPYVTGVQRAVISFIQYGMLYQNNDYVVQSVISSNGFFYPIDASVVTELLHKKSPKSVASLVWLKDQIKHRLSGFFSLIKVAYQQASFVKNRQRIGKRVNFKPRDVLFLPDISWGVGVETSVADARATGVFVAFYIHDLIPILYPQYCDAVKTREFDFFLRQLPNLADGVLTNSQATLDDLTHWCTLNVKHATNWRTKVAYLGVDKKTSHSSARQDLIDFVSSGAPVFMIVNTIEPRKNHTYLLDVFEQLWRDGVQCKLLVIGRIGGDVAELMTRFKGLLIVEPQFMMLNDTDDAELNYAYQHATALVFPSFAEGFGLPIIEALSNGLPVIVSDIPAHGEIAGALGMYVDPTKPIDMIIWIKQIVGMGVDEKYKPTEFNWITWQEATDKVFESLVSMSERKDSL
jgi:alpha-1,2-rhamnosyltransferase